MSANPDPHTSQPQASGVASTVQERVLAGYRSLCACVRWAEEAQDAGEAWGADFAERFRLARDCYAARYPQHLAGGLLELPITHTEKGKGAPKNPKFVKCPPLLKLGGEEAFPDYELVTDCLYRSNRVVDVLKRTFSFGSDTCHHMCFKEPPGFEARMGRRAKEHERTVWVPRRAERLHWMLLALCHPEVEIRPDPVDPERHEDYALAVQDDPNEGIYREMYGVVGEVGTAGRRSAIFITAFPLDDPDTRERWLDSKPLRHPKRHKKHGKHKKDKDEQG